jgi:hypothetical protein
MAYGRPMMIHPSTTSNMVLPSIVDDHLLTSNGNTVLEQTQTQPSSMAFYVHSLKLLQILGDMLDSFYSGGSDHDGSTDTHCIIDKVRAGGFHKLLMFDRALAKWQKELPPYLC